MDKFKTTDVFQSNVKKAVELLLSGNKEEVFVPETNKSFWISREKKEGYVMAKKHNGKMFYIYQK